MLFPQKSASEADAPRMPSCGQPTRRGCSEQGGERQRHRHAGWSENHVYVGKSHLEQCRLSSMDLLVPSSSSYPITL